MLAWENRGISFDAVVRIAGHERARLERQMNDCAPLFRGLDVQAGYCAAQPFIVAETSRAPNESGVASGRRDHGGGVPARSDRHGLNTRFAKSCCPGWDPGQCRTYTSSAGLRRDFAFDQRIVWRTSSPATEAESACVLTRLPAAPPHPGPERALAHRRRGQSAPAFSLDRPSHPLYPHAEDRLGLSGRVEFLSLSWVLP